MAKSFSSFILKIRVSTLVAVAVLSTARIADAQTVGNAGSLNGVVVDVSGAVVPGAKVEIRNPVSGFDRTAVTDDSGKFIFANIPFNPYHLSVTAPGFAAYGGDVELRSSVPVAATIKLQIEGSTTSVTVEANGGDLIEGDPTFHTDVDKNLFEKLPLESQSSSVSSLVTLSTPGIAADSNGLFHGLGDHAENSFSVDGQPITDQQSKVFSNQIPLDAIQSMEVISGAPPAQYGDKTSVGYRRHDTVWAWNVEATWRNHGVLWIVRHCERRTQPRIRRQELGKLRFGQWA